MVAEGAAGTQRVAGETARIRPEGEDLVTISATGKDAEAVILNGLREVLAVARGSAVATAADDATSAAPIRGQGASVDRLFAEIAADLLAQLDAHGLGLDQVRLDGVLETDDGSLTAWGYALGVAADSPPPVGLTLDGDPILEQTADGWTLRARLRRA